MKKLEERIWARILHMPLSQRTKGEVRVEVLKGEVNPEVGQSQKENSSDFIVIKKVMAIISVMENGGLAKDHWCLLEGRFVVHFTRHK